MDFVIGFCIAVVIALSGVGAGVITAPLLILFLHVPVEIAVSTALAYSAIVKFIVVPVQVIRKQVNYRVLGIMLLGGLPGVVLGSILFKHVAMHGPKTALYFVLGAIIVFTSGWHLFRHFRPSGIARPAVGNLTRADPTECRKGQNRHRCDGKEDGALRNVASDDAQRGSGQRVPSRIEALVAADPLGHRAAPDKTQADGRDSRADNGASGAVQHFSGEYGREIARRR